MISICSFCPIRSPVARMVPSYLVAKDIPDMTAIRSS